MNKYLIEQLKLHPSMQMQDVIKLCFQSAYGAEHLLLNVEAARRYFEMEYERTEAADIPLYEIISDTFCRANIAAWKYHNKSREELFQLFIKTAGKKHGDDTLFQQLLAEAVDTVAEGEFHFTAGELSEYIDSYLSDGICAIHHSEQYREKEKPSYRLVELALCKEQCE